MRFKSSILRSVAVAAALSVAGAGTAFAVAATTLVPLASPVLSQLSSGTGYQDGGTQITVSGSRLGGALAITFGGVPGTGLKVAGDGNSATVKTPAHAAGKADLAVRTATGETTAFGAFEFIAPPKPAAVNPDLGTPTGGTEVTVTGTGLDPVTQVTFGGMAGTGLKVAGDGKSLTVTTPAHPLGPVDVAVLYDGGEAVVKSGFTYYLSVHPDIAAPADSKPVTGHLVGW